MMAWVDRNAYMERLWALEGVQSRLFIDEVRLREGFEKASSSIRARGGRDIYLTEFEFGMREEPEKGALAHGELAPGARRLASRRARGRRLLSRAHGPSLKTAEVADKGPAARAGEGGGPGRARRAGEADRAREGRWRRGGRPQGQGRLGQRR